MKICLEFNNLWRVLAEVPREHKHHEKSIVFGIFLIVGRM